jgi:dolichol-phosphate mannosyltransferase
LEEFEGYMEYFQKYANNSGAQIGIYIENLNVIERVRPKVSIIVPTYMEAENIQEFIERVEKALNSIQFELIMVDDNSPDGTAYLAERLNTKYGNIRVLKRKGKLGLGSAVFDGFKIAKSNALAVLDGDLQHPPELLRKMYKKICEGYSLVIASRYVKGGGVEGWGSLRKIISLGAIKLAHLLIPEARKVRDPMSGFFMIRRDSIEKFRPSSRGFKILLEILTKVRYTSVVEVPYTFKPRRRGKSKFNIREILNYLFLIFRLSAFREKRRGRGRASAIH